MTDEQTQIRCVNIDWLEVFCVEPNEPRDANYFELLGYGVKKDHTERLSIQKC